MSQFINQSVYFIINQNLLFILQTSSKSPQTKIQMNNVSKKFPSITSFVSHAASLKQAKFPIDQITTYCKQNDCQYQKIINIYQSYYQKFRWNYDNLKQIVILLGIALKRIQLKLGKKYTKEETQTILKKSLAFIEDLITSKMILVCLAQRKKKNQVYQNFDYIKGFLILLIPQVLDLEYEEQLLDVFHNSNKNPKSPNFNGMNFLVEFMLISTTTAFLGESSEQQFKTVVFQILQNKKKQIVTKIWEDQKIGKGNRLEFKQIGYFRLEDQQEEIHYLQINDEGKIHSHKQFVEQPQSWITQAFKKAPIVDVWKNMKIKTVVDIYQFLFKLQMFASSPHITEVDSLFYHNDQFLQLFSNFLRGQPLNETNNIKKEQNKTGNIIKDISDIKRIFQQAPQPYKKILKKELQKIISETSEEEQSSKTTIEFNIDP